MLLTNYEISEKRELESSINLKNSEEKSKLCLTQILTRVRENENSLKKRVSQLHFTLLIGRPLKS